MCQEQRKMNDKKRQVALQLEKHPEHQGSGNGILNDSHLCCYSFSEDCNPRQKPRVLISVKYVERGKSPGIGFYFESDIKEECLPELNDLKLPDSFYLDNHQINMKSQTKGWVVFCREGCTRFDEMYRQIVQPGDSLRDWEELYRVLKNWLKIKFGRVDYFDKECLAQDNKLTSDSFTSYP